MFTLFIDNRAFADIQDAVDYYNKLTPGSGKKFERALEKEFAVLRSNPFYQVRYKNIRCKLIRRYPYLIHYTLNSRLREIYVFAVICTHQNPKIHWL